MNIFNSLSANALNAIIHRVIKIDPHAQEKAKPLNGKTVEIQINDFNLNYIVSFSKLNELDSPSADYPLVQVLDRYTETPNVSLSGDSFAFFNMATATNGGDALFKGEVIFTGEVSTAQLFEKFWQQLDLDWEEELSKYTGDIVANKLGQFAIQASEFFKQQVSQASNNTRDRLTEELKVTPHKLELDSYFDDIDELSSRVQRLNAKIASLEKAIDANLNEN